MFELARCFGEAPVLMKTIAQRQRLSRKHVHALLTALKSAGLVRSVRGRHGGFFLTRPPNAIRLSEVLRAAEGPLSLVDCVADKQACDRTDHCVARRIWQDLSRAVESMLDNVTLEDMTDLDRKHCSRGRGKKSRAGTP